MNDMPETIISLLSPLHGHDTDHLNLASIPNNATFCEQANLACKADVDGITPLSMAYGYSTHPSLYPVDPLSYFKKSLLFTQSIMVNLPNLESQFPKRAFLPLKLSAKIPMNAKDLETHFPPSFQKAMLRKNMEISLMHCSAPNLQGEEKGCFNSLEGVITFAQAALRANNQQIVALTSSCQGTHQGSQVVIRSVHQVGANTSVSCHEIFFPFMAYYCHVLPSTQVFSVGVVNSKGLGAPDRGNGTTLYAICHLDTSSWPKDHPAFKSLKMSPGEAEVCHWSTKSNIIWILGADYNQH
ncbi:BURP domain-containing protein 16-like [Coffea arabica]|uniref:BURP domain-containing protein 16-like n=1 Tax=Coffea arabica TaxID=13443 RepID=A0ABM4U5H1_COFAR